MQNKANFLNNKPNPTFFAAKVYEKKPPLPNSKKQTQSKPISNAETAYSAYQTRDCRVASLLAMTRCMSYSGWNGAML
jgi:predicted dienelactone hydrolase